MFLNLYPENNFKNPNPTSNSNSNVNSQILYGPTMSAYQNNVNLDSIRNINVQNKGSNGLSNKKTSDKIGDLFYRANNVNSVNNANTSNNTNILSNSTNNNNQEMFNLAFSGLLDKNKEDAKTFLKKKDKK